MENILLVIVSLFDEYYVPKGLWKRETAGGCSIEFLFDSMPTTAISVIPDDIAGKTEIIVRQKGYLVGSFYVSDVVNPEKEVNWGLHFLSATKPDLYWNWLK